jgi:hypothetical protein
MTSKTIDGGVGGGEGGGGLGVARVKRLSVSVISPQSKDAAERRRST